MDRILTLALALALPVLLLSCTDESMPTAPVDNSGSSLSIGERSLSAASLDYHSVLWRSSATAMLGKHHNQSGAFATPLFGLATAPNDDILVADAGAGVATTDGSTDIVLPGVTAIAPLGRGSMWATTTGTDPQSNSGQALYRISQGESRLVVNLFDVEETHNPDGNDPLDSNPYDVAALGGEAALVADAGGNVLYRVDNGGDVEVLAVFPNELVSTQDIKNLVGCPLPAENPQAGLCDLPPQIPAQAVPTSVSVGPDGYYYVGELKGFPAPLGASNIWKVSPDASWADCGATGDCVKVFDGGFTSIIDLAFGADGTLYVAELDENSWFAVEFGGSLLGGTINACDLTTSACTEAATGIPMLTAITLDRGGALWATQFGLVPGDAEVIEVP